MFNKLILVALLFLLGMFAFALKNNEYNNSAEYNAIFMGHSFFAPIVKKIPKHAKHMGYDNYNQKVVFRSGMNGSPGELWKSSKRKVKRAKKMIQKGEVDLVALTFYPEIGSSLEDYQRWISFALEANPATEFIIQAPWAIKQGKQLAEYKKETEYWQGRVHSLIEDLRKLNPGVRITCVPQGRWMVELWSLYKAGGLPEVNRIVASNMFFYSDALFADEFGHGGLIPVEEGALLWLPRLTGVDLNDYNYKTRVKSDIKSIAQRIVESDPYYY